MCSFQLGSDFHLEHYRESDFPENDAFRKFLIPSAPILILAGDIGYPEFALTQRFLKWCASQWKHIIWVFGNHEYYQKKLVSQRSKYGMTILTMKEKEQIAREFLEQSGLHNIVFLQNEWIEFPEFPEIVFYGTTLWTEITDEQAEIAKTAIHDYKYIAYKKEELANFSPTIWQTLHRQAVGALNTFAESESRQNKKVIVISHHVPTQSLIHEKYRESPVNFGYSSSLDTLVCKFDMWVCGHSHGSMESMIPRPCYLNAFGYPKESKELYSLTKVITLQK